MSGQMRWMVKFGDTDNGEKILHLRSSPGEPWKPYSQTVFAVPDLKMGDIKVSRGFRTAQVLLSKGWQYVKS